MESKLRGLARRHLLLGLGKGAARLLLAAALLLAFQAGLDRVADLPRAVRALFLVCDAGALFFLVRNGIVRPWRKRIGLAGAALLAQKRWPELRGSFVAAVQLAAHPPEAVGLVRTLLARAESEAAVRGRRFAEPVSARSFIKITALVLVLWFALGAGCAIAPRIGLALLGRIILLPIPLPTRTVVVPLTKDLSVVVGADVLLRARAEGVVPTTGRVTLFYAGGETQELVPSPATGHPEVFELLIRNVQRPFRYRFSLNDGRGENYTVKTRTPPALQSLACEVVYPAYTGLPSERRSTGDLTVLAGSTLRLRVKATLPLGKALVVPQKQGESQGPPPVEMRIDGTNRSEAVADVPIPAKDFTGFTLRLEGSDGFPSVDDTVYPVQVVPDLPPAVTILEPAETERTITVNARPRIAFTVGDDFGLSRVVLRYEVARPPAKPGTEPPAPVEAKPVEFDLAKLRPPGASSSTPLTFSYEWNAAAEAPPWREGDTVHYWIEAADNNTVTGPGTTATPRRHFILVSPEAKEAEALRRLEQAAEGLRKLRDAQQKAADEVGRLIDGKTP